jgi:hypothetical protein
MMLPTLILSGILVMSISAMVLFNAQRMVEQEA